jgi:hypothetical protein
MAKGDGAGRLPGMDGICDGVTSAWVAQGVEKRKLGQLLRLRGVNLETLTAIENDRRLSESIHEVYERAALAGVSSEALTTLYRAYEREHLVFARIAQILRAVPSDVLDKWEEMLLDEDSNLPTWMRWWGRVRGSLERWVLKGNNGHGLTKTQREALEFALAALTITGHHLELWTDVNGDPHMSSWDENAPFAGKREMSVVS